MTKPKDPIGGFDANVCSCAVPLTFGSLFAGIGGIDLGFERAGMVCKWQVEIDEYARRVLEKHWPNVRRHDDVRTWPQPDTEYVDIIAGGFPCQDISYAGKGAGLAGEQSGLFYEVCRIVSDMGPRIVVLENVSALLTRGLDSVLGTLASLGYDAEWHCIPAAAVGAPHIRDRVFIVGWRLLADAECSERRSCRAERCNLVKQDSSLQSQWQENTSRPGVSRKALAYANCDGLAKRQRENASGAWEDRRSELSGSDWWKLEPAVGRTLDGFSDWLDRNKHLITESHKRIMAYGVLTQGDCDGHAEKKRAEEALRDLRNRFDSQGIQRATGRLVSVSSQEVLFTYLRKHTEETANEAWLQLQGAKAPEDILRSLRTRQELAGSSHRPGRIEQRGEQYPDSLQALSRLLAHDSRSAWLEYCGANASSLLSEWGPGWETGVSRVAHGVPRRVDRLRGLGNAVVPQVAEYIGRCIVAASNDVA